jgi:hypothetical protein
MAAVADGGARVDALPRNGVAGSAHSTVPVVPPLSPLAAAQLTAARRREPPPSTSPGWFATTVELAAPYRLAFGDQFGHSYRFMHHHAATILVVT